MGSKDLDLNLYKKNGGLSSARNAGLEIATGDLFSFDADDYLDCTKALSINAVTKIMRYCND
jgi:glycosyltransferase involved in cell wall biosynthesis